MTDDYDMLWKCPVCGVSFVTPAGAAALCGCTQRATLMHFIRYIRPDIGPLRVVMHGA